MSLTALGLAAAGAGLHEAVHHWRRRSEDVSDDDLEIAALDDKEDGSAEPLAVSASSLALAIAGHLYPPLALAYLAPLGYGAMPIVRDAIEDLATERKVAFPAMDIASIATCCAAGSTVTASFSMLTYHAAIKLARMTRDGAKARVSEEFVSPDDEVHVLRGNEALCVRIRELQVGDLVKVSAGMTVPVDGTVRSGSAMVDQQAMTGEARPAELQAGDTALAATLVLRGELQIEAMTVGADTVAGQVAKMLNSVGQHKSGRQLFAEKFLDRLSPAMLGAGLLAVPTMGLDRAAAILYLMPFYWIRIVAPVGALGVQARAVKDSILIKDGSALEHLPKVDTVVFDKTGTLTTGEMRVAETASFADIDRQELLRLAASVENGVDHPIARGLGKCAAETGIALSPSDDRVKTVGLGVGARIDGAEVLVGSPRFLGENSVSVAVAAPFLQASEAAGRSPILIARDGVCIGGIALDQDIREGAAELVRDLKAAGIRVLLMSGDGSAATEALGAELRLDEVISGCLPTDKAAHVERLKAEGRTVCFVGDGINDGVALRAANVAISLHGASTLAQDVAQIILTSADLRLVETILMIGRSYDFRMKTAMRLYALESSADVFGIALLGWGMGPTILTAQASLWSSMAVALAPESGVARARTVASAVGRRAGAFGRTSREKLRRLAPRRGPFNQPQPEPAP